MLFLHNFLVYEISTSLIVLLLYFYHINYIGSNNSINTSYKDVLTPKITNTDNLFKLLSDNIDLTNYEPLFTKDDIIRIRNSSV